MTEHKILEGLTEAAEHAKIFEIAARRIRKVAPGLLDALVTHAASTIASEVLRSAPASTCVVVPRELLARVENIVSAHAVQHPEAADVIDAFRAILYPSKKKENEK